MTRAKEQTRKKDEGIPGNAGEYAGVVQSPPADSTLPASDILHNAQGSFLYPPSVRSAEQAIEFWEHVDIDDAVLQKFQTLYQGRLDALANPNYEKRVRALVEKKMADFDAEVKEWHDSPEFKDKWAGSTDIGRAKQAAADAEARSHNWDVFSAEARVEVPPPSVSEVDPATIPYPSINRSEVRPLVRAAALYAYTPTAELIGEENRERIMSHLFDLGYEKIMSVRDIEATYRLSEIDGFLDA
jgi:hypothetical protein